MAWLKIQGVKNFNALFRQQKSPLPLRQRAKRLIYKSTKH